MQVGAALLRDTNATVASVAQDVGYDSEAAFARAFKRLVGRPPAAWRRQTAHRVQAVRRDVLDADEVSTPGPRAVIEAHRVWPVHRKLEFDRSIFSAAMQVALPSLVRCASSVLRARSWQAQPCDWPKRLSTATGIPAFH